MRARSFDTSEELETALDQYFEGIGDRPVTVAGMCLHLGVTRQTLCLYESGEYNSDTHKNQFSEILKLAKLRVEQDKNEKLLTGEYNAAGAIFDLKNNHQWTDKLQTVTTHRGAIISEEPMTEAEWFEKYGE